MENGGGNDGVTFLGAGTMGAAPARRALDHQIADTVWNRTAEKAGLLAGLGARFAAKPAGAVGRNDLVFVCVSDAVASRGILLTDNRVSAALRG